ncbi:MAG: ABC transporter ATP-binding protein [candidate division WOR-3 bacterium]
MIKLENVVKIYKSGQEEVRALNGLTLEIGKGEFIVLAGPSGSGKTTMLNVISGIEKPTEGRVLFEGKDIGKMDEDSLSDLRLKRIGFVFQTYNLIPVLTAFENVEIILALRGVKLEERKRRIGEIFEVLGLKGLENRFPKELSGGQQQRVAIARAIVGNPAVVLADEPTANLDSKNALNVMNLMLKLNEEFGTTFIFATHDPMIIELGKRIIRLRDGRIVEDVRKG